MSDEKLPAAETADDILSTDDLEILPVPVPEWKRTVHLRVIPADEGLKLDEAMKALPKEKGTEALFLLLGACLVTADGKRLFTTDEQLQKLHTRSPKVLLRLQAAALELQGWRIEGTAKNA